MKEGSRVKRDLIQTIQVTTTERERTHDIQNKKDKLRLRWQNHKKSQIITKQQKKDP